MREHAVKYAVISENNYLMQAGIIIQQFISTLWLQFPKLEKYVENGAVEHLFCGFQTAVFSAFAILGEERRKDSQLLMKIVITGKKETVIDVYFYELRSLDYIDGNAAIRCVYHYYRRSL